MTRKSGCKYSPAKLMKTPIGPVEVDPRAGLRDVLLSMSQASFQGRMLGDALRVWEEMLDARCYIYLGLSGALVPAGMRKILDWLIRTEKIHCLVSTGANLFHELHESIGYRHYKGHPRMDDVALNEIEIDRIYDTLAFEKEFRRTDVFVRDFAAALAKKYQKVTTAKFFDELGAYLKKKGGSGFIVSAHEKKTPVFCPAIGDSSYGIAMAGMGSAVNLTFDVIGDIYTISTPMFKGKKCGVIYLGGGTPKNYIQQAEVVAQFRLRNEKRLSEIEIEKIAKGYEFAIQITTDTPQWGGLSGCTLQEGQSWGKESADAQIVNLYCDVTIALPLLANALAQKPKKRSRK